MGKIIAVLNFKGGVGKTTTAVNLADALTYRGKNVLVVDCDSQRNATIILDRDKDVDETIYTSMEAMVMHKLNAGITVFEHGERRDGCECVTLDFVPGDIRLKDVDVLLAGTIAKETVLRKLLSGLRGYDYILIDCPPNAGVMTVNAMVASDYLLIPIDSQPMALDGLADIIQLYNEVRAELNPNLAILGYLLTRYRKNYATSAAVEQFLTQRKETYLLQTYIHENITIGKAAGQRMTVYEYDSQCRGANDYTALAFEIINKIEKQ